MSAIKFVVRDSMGNINRGDVAGDGAPASLFVTEGQDISLNLRPTQITSYERNGQALEITLIDGRVVVIEGFFSPEGVVENRLVISADGTLSEVILVGDGSGQLAVQYADADEFGKYSPNDQLYFLRGQDTLISSAAPADDEAAMLAAPGSKAVTLRSAPCPRGPSSENGLSCCPRKNAASAAWLGRN